VTRPREVTAFAPGSVGNIGPGLDILGLAVAGLGDHVTARLGGAPGVRLLDPGHPELSADPARHSAALAADAVLRRAGANYEGVSLTVRKGLPLSGGQGGSAASAVAAAVAVNALLETPLDADELLAACVAAESVVAGRHADNVAPSLLGGVTLVRSLEPLDVIPLPVPANLAVVLALPEQRLRTADSRAVLPLEVSREVALHQAAQVGAMVAALCAGDLALLGRAIDDRIAEPARARLLPGFREAKAAALEAGALGASISGSGPTAFALVAGRGAGDAVAHAMQQAYHHAGLACRVRVADVDRDGARLVPTPPGAHS
jgi:homoserine kinase